MSAACAPAGDSPGLQSPIRPFRQGPGVLPGVPLVSAHKFRACRGVCLYLGAVLGAGAIADIVPCGTETCIRVQPSDDPLTTFGPFRYATGAFAPADNTYTTAQLAQNYAALYYAQYLVWRDLQSTCPGSSSCLEDLDGDGSIGLGDIIVVLTKWNQSCLPSLPAESPAPVGQ